MFSADDHTADRGAVPADIFGQRMNDNGRTMVERPCQYRRRRIVDDQRDSAFTPDGGHLGDGKHLELRVRQRLGVIGPCALVAGLGEIFRPRRIDKAHLDALLAQRVLEQVPGAAIQVCRADDIVSRLGKILHRIGRRRLAGGHGERRRPALDGGDPLLQHIRRRIHDARVDIAKLRQAEQVRRMFG